MLFTPFGFRKDLNGSKTREITFRVGLQVVSSISEKNTSLGDSTAFLLNAGKRLGLSEGEGEIVYAGTWSVKGEIVEVDYRLVGMYKVISQPGNKAPEIPGPVQHIEMRLDPKLPMHLEFDGVGFQASSHLKASDFKERLRIYAAKLKEKDPTN